MSNNGEYKDVVTFVEKRGGGKKPIRIGWAKVGQDGKISGAIEGVVNFSFVIEDRRERSDNAGSSYGKSGHGASAKHSSPNDDDSSDIPF